VAGALAREVAVGERPGPEVIYASLMAGPEFFRDPRVIDASVGFAPGDAPWAQAVTAATDPVVAVAAARGSGAEVLKLYAALEPLLVRTLTEEAHRQGLRVVAHGTVFPARPGELVAAGVDVLTHAPYLSWEGGSPVVDDLWRRRDGPYDRVAPAGPAMDTLLRAMAARGTVLEPTLLVFERTSAEDSTAIAWGRALTRRAAELGVAIVAGTDGLIDARPGSPPNIHLEMAALVRAGLSPAQALSAATVTAARALGRGATHGRVEPGRVADLVLLAADPLEDIAATRRVRWVIRRGRLLDVAGG
jgi:imidazolonepropionase-like amidohydrolase